MENFPWAPFVIGIAVALVPLILIWIYASGGDEDRIRRYLELHGGRLIECNRLQFAPGWLWTNDRTYRVRYLDKDGNEHQAHCKTSISSGVSFTNDEIAKYAEHPAEQPGSSEEENRRLREELER